MSFVDYTIADFSLFVKTFGKFGRYFGKFGIGNIMPTQKYPSFSV